jgi:hypothetical protein
MSNSAPELALGRLSPPLARPRRPRVLDRPLLDPGDLSDQIEPVPPLPPGTAPEPEPGFFNGGFAGQTVLMIEDPPARPGIPGGGPVPPARLREAGSVNLRQSLLEVWNDWIQPLAGRQFERVIEEICAEDLPSAIRKLYRAEADINPANAGSSSLSLLVSPRHRSFSLFFLIGAEHQLRCKADVKVLSDPTITVDFGLATALSFVSGDRPAPIRPPATSKCLEGPPPEIQPVNVNGSLWLTSAQLRLMGPRARVSKGLDLRIVEVFVGSFAQRIEIGLAGDSADLMTASPFLIRDLRDAMREVEQQGTSTADAIPWYDDESRRLQVRLRQPSTFDVQPDVVLSL